mgnify:CR=1 FL=1
MRRDRLMKISASNTSQSIKNQIITIYERENIPGLNGFALTWEELCKDTEELDLEILDIMTHPRKYAALLKVFAYFQGMMLK